MAPYKQGFIMPCSNRAKRIGGAQLCTAGDVLWSALQAGQFGYHTRPQSPVPMPLPEAHAWHLLPNAAPRQPPAPLLLLLGVLCYGHSWTQSTPPNAAAAIESKRVLQRGLA